MSKIFYSKRNVVKKQGMIVVKTVKDSDAAKKEAKKIRALYKHRVKVPRVYGVIREKIIMQYIQGITLPDWIEKMEKKGQIDREEVSLVVNELCEWLSSFYKAVEHTKTGMILDDVNGRNFLITPDKAVYGIDFEEEKTGRVEENIGELLAFIVTYDPANTAVKKMFVKELISCVERRLGIGVEQVTLSMDKAQGMLEKRRELGKRK